MSNRVPIACSLSGGEATVRAAELADLGERALIRSELNGASATLGFNAAVRDELRAVIESESACCPFFAFELTETDSELVLTVSADADAAPAVAELVAAFTSVGASA